MAMPAIHLDFPIQEIESALRSGDSSALSTHVLPALEQYAQRVETDRAKVVEVANLATSLKAEHAGAREALDQAADWLRALEPAYLKQAIAYSSALEAVADVVEARQIGSAEFRVEVREQISRFKDLSRLGAETIGEARANVETHAEKLFGAGRVSGQLLTAGDAVERWFRMRGM